MFAVTQPRMRDYEVYSIRSGVYPYLQMAQLSRGQFWGETKKTLE